MLEERRHGQEALDQPAEGRLRRERRSALTAVGACGVGARGDGRRRRPSRSQGAVDPLTRERVDEPGGVAHQQPPRPGNVRDAMADRRRSADRGQALASGEPPGHRREPRDRGPEALGRGGAAVHRQCHADVQLAVRQRREPDVVAATDVHLPVIGEVRISGVVGHEPEAPRVADRPLDAGEAGDRGAHAVGADDKPGLDPASPAVGGSRHGTGDPLTVHLEADEPGALDELCAQAGRVGGQLCVEPGPVEAPCLTRAVPVGVGDHRAPSTGHEPHAGQRERIGLPLVMRETDACELLDDPRAGVLGAGLRAWMMGRLEQDDARTRACEGGRQRGAGGPGAGDQDVAARHAVAAVTTRGSHPTSASAASGRPRRGTRRARARCRRAGPRRRRRRA